MAEGPGSYDKECTAARVSAKAEIAILLIVGGDRGSGFSAQFQTAIPGQPPASIEMIPNILRGIADSIEADNVQRRPRITLS